MRRPAVREDELENQELVKLKETFFIKEARSCLDWVERDFFNTGGVKGRTEFEYICSICGAPPEDSPLVADAVLGMRDGKKLLPCCADCHAAGKQPLAYGRADQPKLQAAKRKRKAEQREGAAKLPARGRGRGGRPRGLEFTDSEEEEEMGSASTPPPRVPSGSDEESDVEEDELDDSSSPDLGDSD